LSTVREASEQELEVKARLLARHPSWTIELKRMTATGSDWWEIRDARDQLLARQRDIVLAAEVATGKRLLA